MAFEVLLQPAVDHFFYGMRRHFDEKVLAYAGPIGSPPCLQYTRDNLDRPGIEKPDRADVKLVSGRQALLMLGGRAMADGLSI